MLHGLLGATAVCTCASPEAARALKADPSNDPALRKGNQ